MKNRMAPIVRTVRDLFFPPRCAACGTLLPLAPGGAPALCHTCRTAWEKETLHQCPDCFLPFCRCRCMPRALGKTGVSALVKLAPYSDDGTSPITHRLVLGMKDKRRTRVFRFCAAELAEQIREEIRQTEVALADTALVFLPRSRRAVRRDGFDQAKELAHALGVTLGIAELPCLKRVKDGKAQKNLTTTARRQNVKGAFRVVGDVRGKSVIVVDDIVTTGASMTEAIRLLTQSGAHPCLAVSVAQTPKKQKT